MTIPFYKMVGAGNDFVFVLADDISQIKDRPALAREVCKRNFSIGSDGFVVIENIRQDNGLHTFDWDFYNSDGSAAKMCGNAARCAVIFSQIIFSKKSCQFHTAIGRLHGEICELGSQVTWNLIESDPKEISIQIESQKDVHGFFVNSGVPHFVVLQDPSQPFNGRDCLLIQSHPDFAPEETNVTLLEQKDDGPHIIKTFERGVRNFTLACGTGAIAGGLVLQKLTGSTEHQLQFPGGLLAVKFNGDKVSHQGPAKCVYKGSYNYDI